MLPFRDQLGVLNVLLIYLLLIFVLALTTGLWPAVFSAVIGFLIFDFAFIPPYRTFTVAEPDHVLALFVYLGVAVVTAHLVSRVRARTDEALQESRRSAILAELNAALIADVTLPAILEHIAERVVTAYGADECRVLVPGADGTLHAGAQAPTGVEPAIDRTGQALAAWVMEHRQPAGQSRRGRRIVGTGRDPSVPSSWARRERYSDVLYLPIMTAERVDGVLQVVGRPGSRTFHAEDERLLMTFVHQAALALERARLSDEAAQAEVLAKSDELKSALLAAVSHDLRTPLASIKASATSLLDESVAWSAETRYELLTAIDEETDRLTLMVSNFLNLSRIEGGALRPQVDWYDIDELINDVRERLATRTADHPVRVVIEPNLPILQFDYVQIAQVLVNLLENAVKYTPRGTPITISARRLPGAVEISVHDEGPGIPQIHQSRLFEKFSRVPSGASGTGIGLAICKGLVDAHGGAMSVESAPGAGTTFRFTLPIAAGDLAGVPHAPGVRT